MIPQSFDPAARRAFLASLRTALALLGAFLALALGRARAEETVSVEVVKSLAQAPYYIALAKGYFAEEGLKIEAGDVRSALDTIGPLATGRLDASLGAATAGFFNAAHGGFDLRVVAALGVQGPVMATQPVVRKALWDDGSIRNGKDLRGRRVAINAPGDVTEYFLTLILDKYGMTMKDPNVTPLAFAEQLVAFKNGAIDAGWLPEPLSTSSRLAGDVALMEPEAGVGQGTATTFLFYGTRFMRDRPKVALAFLRALVRAAREAQGDYNKNPAYAEMIAKEMGMKAATIEQCTPYAVDTDLDIAKFEPDLRREEAVHRRNGRLSYDGALDFRTVIDAALVHEAAASIAGH